MSKQIFITLPVRDVEKSKAFYAAIGYAIDPRFGSDKGAGVVINENTFLMLSNRDFFKELASRDVCDTSTHAQALFALVADSREQVDELLGKALAAGGSEAHEPEDYGFMYQRAFRDLDGHGFAVNHMREDAASSN